MKNVTDRVSNPFGMQPDCDRFVPGYGDANADFHVIGDHPGVHGGVETGVPFTGTTAGRRLLDALRRASLLDAVGDAPAVNSTFLSYLHMCVPTGERATENGTPTPASYDDMERFFDAELRAIAAHVLLPVGERVTRHVLETYTARPAEATLDMDALHGNEIRGSGWLVLPIKEPAEWITDDRTGDDRTGDDRTGEDRTGDDHTGDDRISDDRPTDADTLVDALETLQSTDYRRESDLGRFVAGADPYLVR